MKILIISRYKSAFADHLVPFVTEQGESLCQLGHTIEYFAVKGNYLFAVRGLKQKIRTFQPDIIHAHYGLSAITAELQSMVPVVTTFHNGETLNKGVNLLTSLCSLRAKHVVYVAQHIYDLVYFKHTKYSIIPCGVNMEDCVVMNQKEAREQLGFENGVKYILFGGGFDNLRKNYAILRDAVERIEQQTWIPVEGGERCGNIVCLEMKGLSRAECVLRMNACDLFALPSHSEGSPQALKEAMACNCPIIATNMADVKHLLGDLSGHYLLRNPRPTHERWDADERSLDEMVELLKQALAFNGRTNGRERIMEMGLSNEQVAEQLLRIYKHLIG
ncbi:MAG: glycosyltransferase family 4 protein [Paludibacteraceae bacterium]|nr:glycosyltransferase family 4 protein [Paludibacteraceae bacterium]